MRGTQVWNFSIVLNKLLKYYSISLPQAFLGLNVGYRTYLTGHRVSQVGVDVSKWVPASLGHISAVSRWDGYQKYKHFFHQKADKCDTKHKPVSSHLCLMIHGKARSFIIFNSLIFNKLRLLSWNEVSEACRNVGGYLPYFTSKNEFDQLIGFLKLSRELPTIPAIFIGYMVQEKKVGFE